LEQPPVGFGEALEEFADLEMVARHGTDQWHQFFTDVFSDSLLLDFDGEVIAALGGVFVEGTLEEVEGLVDLALELFLAELEGFALFAHKYAYLYVYIRA
jgi:hypothetical protein